MSNERTILDYLEDISGAISDIRMFIQGMSAVDFMADKKTVNAVIRSLEIIGEATGKIPKDVVMRYPNVPWDEIIGMRNRLIHEYFGVDIDIVWQTVQDDLIPLETAINTVLMLISIGRLLFRLRLPNSEGDQYHLKKNLFILKSALTW